MDNTNNFVRCLKEKKTVCIVPGASMEIGVIDNQPRIIAGDLMLGRLKGLISFSNGNELPIILTGGNNHVIHGKKLLTSFKDGTPFLSEAEFMFDQLQVNGFNVNTTIAEVESHNLISKCTNCRKLLELLLNEPINNVIDTMIVFASNYQIKRYEYIFSKLFPDIILTMIKIKQTKQKLDYLMN
jgi:hypothetical protein